MSARLEALVAAGLLLAACSTSADTKTSTILTDAMTASRQAAACRRSLASSVQYSPIARHMPLADPYESTVRQMADPRHANPEEVAAALLAWTQDLQQCRYKAFVAIGHDSPTALASVLAAWNAEDEIYVMLSKGRLTWGDAVTRLTTARADLLSKLTDQELKISAQLNVDRQAELSRRVSILNALTNLAP